MADRVENPYLGKVDGITTVTPAGYEYLKKYVTNTTGDVYAFYPEMSPATIAAAITRLSRQGSDMRNIILSELAMNGDQDAQALLDRVLNGIGDDSVAQLVGIHVVVEGASNLLTKMLERGRILGAIEQSSRYIFFDQKNSQGQFNYLRLDYLPEELRQTYHQGMDQLFDNYSEVVRGVTDFVRTKHPQGDEPKTAWMGSTRGQACDAARVMLPVSARSTVGLYVSAQALQALIIRLQSEDLPEAQETAEQLLVECRKVIPVFLERADKPDRGLAASMYRSAYRTAMREIGQRYLVPSTPKQEASVRLVRYSPENEADLVAEMLFEQSDMSLDELKRQTANWSDDQIQEVFAAYLGDRLNRRNKPGRAIEDAHFEWEIVGGYGDFRDIQRHRMVDAMEWQRLSPSYGFEVMAGLVAEAGKEDLFRASFDLSRELYQQLMDGGYPEEAQYATLFGHRMRYRFTTNLREAFHLIELRTGPGGHPGYRRICQEMYQQLVEAYPRLGAGMIFVNKDEDQELSRLAAERAAVYKLERMGLTPMTNDD